MPDTTDRDASLAAAPARVPLREALGLWARLGLLSFGGPAGQIALMHRWLVAEKRWIPESEFLHALNFCMLLPGPEAQQLATYAGWKLHGIHGGLAAGTLFILPGAVVVMVLSYLYLAMGELALVRGLFEGLKPAVVVIVLQAVLRIGGRTLRGPSSIGLALAAFVAMFVFQVPFPAVIGAAALLGAVMLQRDAGYESDAHATHHLRGSRWRSLRLAAVFLVLWLAPTTALLAWLGGDQVFTEIGVFFSKMAVVTFGGAYAVLAYVSQEAVTTYGWLEPGEMIDGLAMAETTPGPLILVTQFVGFAAAYREPGGLSPLLAGVLGGALTTWVTFVPCYLWIFLGAPHMDRLRQNPRMAAALRGVTAAVVGVIVNLALWFSLHVLFSETRTLDLAGARLDWPVPGSVRVPALLMTAIAAVLVFRFKASVVTTLGVTGALGILLTLVTGGVTS